MDERELDALRDAVIGRAHPDTIILFSQKRGLDLSLIHIWLYDFICDRVYRHADIEED